MSYKSYIHWDEKNFIYREFDSQLEPNWNNIWPFNISKKEIESLIPVCIGQRAFQPGSFIAVKIMESIFVSQKNNTRISKYKNFFFSTLIIYILYD